jgi:hypothetical protein
MTDRLDMRRHIDGHTDSVCNLSEFQALRDVTLSQFLRIRAGQIVDAVGVSTSVRYQIDIVTPGVMLIFLLTLILPAGRVATLYTVKLPRIRQLILFCEVVVIASPLTFAVCRSPGSSSLAAR